MSDPQEICECGHVREAHEHYRKGTDCGICGAETCGAFRPAAELPGAGDGLSRDSSAHTA